MKTAALIFPHQLFKELPFEGNVPVYLVEEQLFFKQFKFHKRKISFHRASLKSYENHLINLDFNTSYINSAEDISDVRILINQLANEGFQKLIVIDPTDDWLNRRIVSSCEANNLSVEIKPSPLFLNSTEEIKPYFEKQKSPYSQTSFYVDQRKKRGILLENGKAKGGKWSYDAENRKRFPKNKQAPVISWPESNSIRKEAMEYTEEHFGGNPGELNENYNYPVNHEEAEAWLDQFLKFRFKEFGDYEDAIVSEQHFLNHSLLSPLINVGLLSPQLILEKTLEFAVKNQIPLNSTEGFVRQVMGWREFLRGVYEFEGRKQRTLNYWSFERKIPPAFYTGETGIVPIDNVIKKVLETGYCHHIERLMVIGNFMLLCEFDPDEVYRWFMELFIDSYDWVMVPNVYGMSQFADGGLMASKPYISGSNYLKKMGDYEGGPWQEIWNSLFWRFMHVHRDFFLSNPRLGMLVKTFDKMSDDKKENHLEKAETYLRSLDPISA